ncbi:hypothetical protein MRX96_014375 [Rhipicephalus microplus]
MMAVAAAVVKDSVLGLWPSPPPRRSERKNGEEAVKAPGARRRRKGVVAHRGGGRGYARRAPVSLGGSLPPCAAGVLERVTAAAGSCRAAALRRGAGSRDVTGLFPSSRCSSPSHSIFLALRFLSAFFSPRYLFRLRKASSFFIISRKTPYIAPHWRSLTPRQETGRIERFGQKKNCGSGAAPGLKPRLRRPRAVRRRLPTPRVTAFIGIDCAAKDLEAAAALIKCPASAKRRRRNPDLERARQRAEAAALRSHAEAGNNPLG